MIEKIELIKTLNLLVTNEFLSEAFRDECEARIRKLTGELFPKTITKTFIHKIGNVTIEVESGEKVSFGFREKGNDELFIPTLDKTSISKDFITWNERSDSELFIKIGEKKDYENRNI